MGERKDERPHGHGGLAAFYNIVLVVMLSLNIAFLPWVDGARLMSFAAFAWLAGAAAIAWARDE